MPYIKEDLFFNHYVWNIDRRDEIDAADLNNMPLNHAEGYEFLLFANSFLDIYLPHNTIEDLYSLEFVLLHHLPPYIKAKSNVATWLASNTYFLTFTKNMQLYHHDKIYRKHINQNNSVM